MRTETPSPRGTTQTAIDIARSEAVGTTLYDAMGRARMLGIPNKYMVFENEATKRQARSLLFDALIVSFGVNALEVTKVLHSLRAIDRAGAYDHEAMAEMWEIIEDTAREECRDNRERME